MLLPADAVPRETQRRRTWRADRWKERGQSSVRGWLGVAADGERDERLQCGRSEEVERGKSSARSTIFPSRRAVTFYLASFGECSDWSVGERNFVFLARREEVTRTHIYSYTPTHTHVRYTFRVTFSQPPRRGCIVNPLLCK